MADLNLWERSHIPPRPKWARQFNKINPEGGIATIHDAINRRGEKGHSPRGSNVLPLLGLGRKNNNGHSVLYLREYLNKEARAPWDIIHNPGRYFSFRRWYYKMIHARG